MFHAFLSDNFGMLRSVLFAGAMALAALAHGQDIKIGFVDAVRLERESVQGRKAIEQLKQEFGPREKEIMELQVRIKDERDRFESERATLSKTELAERWKPITELMKKSDRMVYAMQDDMRLRKTQLMGNFLQARERAIAAVGKAQGFDLVVQEAIFSSKRIDVTDQVLAEMARGTSQ